MCGIAGWIDYDADITRQQSALDAMVAPLTCRGPDGSGTFVTPNAGLGHRRLVVIDPEGGMQPMSRRLGNHVYTIVYNGELYNFQELRQQLEHEGFQFRSRSDTEVLLTSYVAWGTACVSKLNGIFAFAIWDSKDRTLFMARDRLGVKPLFYSRQGPRMLFASELKGILAHPAINAEVDAEGLAEVFAIGPARTPGHGVFRNIDELRPGYYLYLSPTTHRLAPYWQLNSQPHEDSWEQTTGTVRNLVEDTVKRQLVADVPVITLLSGGLDSSVVTAIAAQVFKAQRHEPLNTYSIDFVDMERYFKANKFQTNLDAPWVEKVSTYLGTNHHRVIVDTPELYQDLLAAMRARDLPGMADVDTSLLIFSREIKKAATVGLSGEAADEIFGGYPWFHHPDAIAANTFPWARRLKDRIRILSPEFAEYIQPESYVARRYLEALDEVPRLPSETAEEARIREIAYLSITRFLPTLLDRKDRMTMAVGLEVRVPFCDHRLVEYVWNIPWSWKNYDNVAKGVLRHAMQGILPPDVLMRQKSPYPSTPNPTYFMAMRQGLDTILSDSSSPVLPLLDIAEIRRVMELGPMGDQIPWFGQLMGNAQLFAFLIQANAWLKEYHIATL